MSTNNRYKILSEYDTETKKFNVFKKTVVFEIREAAENEDILEWIKSATTDVVTYIFKIVKPTDTIGLTFHSESFHERQPGWLSFRPANQVSFDDVWNVLGAILQSNSETLSTDKFRIVLTRVELPKGKGRRQNKHYNSFTESCKKKKGIVTIKNRDNLCLLMAICVAKYFANENLQYRSIKSNIKRQHREALELKEKIGMTVPEDGCGINELQLIQNYLEEYSIIVYKYETKGRETIFDGRNEHAKYKINLLYHENHYNVITSLTAAFGCSYFCEDCRVPYNQRNKHRCSKSCPCCQQQPPCKKQGQDISCSTCNREFRNRECFRNHQKKLCQTVRKCGDCFKTYKIRNRPHVCGENYCKVCQDFKTEHHCYMRVNEPKNRKTSNLFVFFDLETRQEKLKPNNPNVKIHEPNLCVSMHCCDECYNNYELKTCTKCGIRENIIFGDNCIFKFIDYLMQIRNKFDRVTCIAHNGQAFDTRLILQYVLKETHHKPKLIMRGLKILKLEIANVVFLDSLCYFPMKLKDLPKTFELPVDIKKGYFPYLFNTVNNEDYVGPLPCVEFYDPDTMKTDDRNEFLKWYNETKSSKYIFNMKEELIEYCRNDVDILRRACIMFRNLLMTECKVCPFTEAMTIASTCHLAFRRNFLKPNTIGILPKNGYRCADKQSKVAIKWLIWEAKRRNISIQHAVNQREIKIANMKVDGYCHETKQVFEFFGCYYHGCKKCMSERRNDADGENDTADTLNERYENTVAKIKKLHSLGYEVITMWECEFQNIIKREPEMKFLDNHFLLTQTPLNPRDAFYGGRTETVRLWYEAKADEKIKYQDVCSLYPWVCKYGRFPKGHPILYVGEDECKQIIDDLSLDELNGLVKCTVLPPQDLFHPVLPIKMHNKLIFTLCRTCAEAPDEVQSKCNHREKERMLTGVWVIEEVKKAVKKGYEILNVYEIWNYETVMHDETNDGLFTEFINKFLKMKQEASGWPSDCKTKKKKDKHVQNYQQHENILLDKDKVDKNPGRRTLAKLMLNSFWGKFGQKENQPKTVITDDASEFFQLLCNEKVVVNQIQEINENKMIVNWEYKDDEAEPLTVANVVIAAHVTALARLKLYSFLEKLEDRVLYCDTDSVIYISRQDLEDLPVGHYLGDLTDELEKEYGPGSYITQFVSGGPKNYGFNVFSTNTKEIHSKCKVKGITLNHANSKKVNFDTLSKLAFDKEDKGIIVECKNIRSTQDHEVITQTEPKTVRSCITKRRVVNDYDTEPFGYISQKRRKLNTSNNATCSGDIYS